MYNVNCMENKENYSKNPSLYPFEKAFINIFSVLLTIKYIAFFSFFLR